MDASRGTQQASEAIAGGVSFAFSGFVMQGLDRRPPASHVRTAGAIIGAAVLFIVAMLQTRAV